MPIPDFDVPSRAQMVRILDEIDQALMAQRKVYVHCLAGLGRTGTVVGCYLVRHGLSGPDALKRIQVLRRDALGAHDPSPTTEAQRRMVQYWDE
jgi:protein-tyrosine phosphatase